MKEENRYDKIKRIVESKLVDRIDKDYTELSEEAFGKAYSSDVARRMFYGAKKVIDAINKYGAATLVQGNYDTVYEIENDTIKKVLERKNVVSGASPEGFKFKQIYDIYKNATEDELAKMTSAGAIAISNGLEMKTIETDLLNLKITFRRDIELFRKLINCYYFKDEDDMFEK